MRTSLRRYYEILSKYLANQRLSFLLLTVLLFGSIGFSLIIPQIMRYFIDAVQSGEPMTNLIASALAFLGAALLQQLLSVSAAYMGSSVAWTATNALREDITAHCIDLDIGFHKEKSPGEFIERIEGDATAFNQFFSQLVIRIAGNILLLGGILTALFLINYRIGIAFTVFSSAALYVLNKVRAISVPKQKALREAETDLFGFLEERLEYCWAERQLLSRIVWLRSIGRTISSYWRKEKRQNTAAARICCQDFCPVRFSYGFSENMRELHQEHTTKYMAISEPDCCIVKTKRGRYHLPPIDQLIYQFIMKSLIPPELSVPFGFPPGIPPFVDLHYTNRRHILSLSL